MSSYELIFKIINITSGTNLKVCSLSISTSAIESCSVDLTYIINIYSISILDCQRCICTVGRCFRSFRCCCGICCFCYLRSLSCICFRSFCNLLSLSSFLCRSRCCSRCNIFMIVCYFKSLENFLFSLMSASSSHFSVVSVYSVCSLVEMMLSFLVSVASSSSFLFSFTT